MLTVPYFSAWECVFQVIFLSYFVSFWNIDSLYIYLTFYLTML